MNDHSLYVPTVRDVAEELTDPDARRWWMDQAVRHGIPSDVLFEVADAAAECLLANGRLSVGGGKP